MCRRKTCCDGFAGYEKRDAPVKKGLTKPNQPTSAATGGGRAFVQKDYGDD